MERLATVRISENFAGVHPEHFTLPLCASINPSLYINTLSPGSNRSPCLRNPSR
jgi:hypothetical protein